jgi:hypothetical protein
MASQIRHIQAQNPLRDPDRPKSTVSRLDTVWREVDAQGVHFPVAGATIDHDVLVRRPVPALHALNRRLEIVHLIERWCNS